jgi:precorrin-8X/cobalt-precorrin-8 methylmutase
MSEPLFDRYIVVDWSASKQPTTGKDSIWLTTVSSDGVTREPINPPTRAEARTVVTNWLVDECREGRRVLVGFDFPYGYPAGFAGCAGLGGSSAWRSIWRHLHVAITDEANNVNNRWEIAADLNARCGAGPGPFWGCPPSGASGHLTSRRLCTFPYGAATGAGPPLEEHRLTERTLRVSGRQVQSAWKLFGAGSVGSQALLGIPVLETLRTHPTLSEFSAVWPFETGLSMPMGKGPGIVHAEIWPGVATLEPSLHPVRDAAQVLTLALHFAGLDQQGRLARLFTPDVDPTEAAIVVGDEGWILGA